jgi:hypothetical protein
MKLKCRDASKIPKERLFCMDKKLYKITIVVEGQEAYRGAYKGGGDDRKKMIRRKMNLMMPMTWKMIKVIR